ncbi:hypothetical protein LTR10_012919 [Elasticomyces elasticus]|nr:hypothetical protein LTR10_012919 [Elasticomyces elasticus]
MASEPAVDIAQVLADRADIVWYYYESAVECYTYLADVTATEPTVCLEQFRQSDIFNRGWTLQELIAPERVVFVSSSWDIIGLKYPPNHSASEVNYIGSTGSPKVRLTEELHALTRVPVDVLAHSEIRFKYSVAQRMSWVSRRTTTRLEDIAYCLLGLFDINMPLLYGERQGAFLRLQREIFARSEDETMLAWPRDLFVGSAEMIALHNGAQTQTQAKIADLESGIFASRPGRFVRSDQTRVASTIDRCPLHLTGNGMQITVNQGTQSRVYRSNKDPWLARLFLDAHDDAAPWAASTRVCIYLRQVRCGHWRRTSILSDHEPRDWIAYPAGKVLLIHISQLDANRHCSQSKEGFRPS